MSPSKTTSQLQLLLLGMLLILLLPTHTMTAPTRSNCTQTLEYEYPWTPLHRLLAGVEVLKTYEGMPSLQNNTSIQISSQQMGLLCSLVILHELSKKVDLNLSELTRQNVKDAGEWLSFVHRNDTNNATLYERQLYEHCLQPYLGNVTQYDAAGHIRGSLAGKIPSPPSIERLQAMWIYSNNGTLHDIINCSSLYKEDDCTKGAADVIEKTCPICKQPANNDLDCQ